jgi:predicted ATPase
LPPAVPSVGEGKAAKDLAMYVRQLDIENIRCIERFTLRFSTEEAPGWHVILGSNGSGKSSIIRSLALALVGTGEAYALRQNWKAWCRSDTQMASISFIVEFKKDDRASLLQQGPLLESTILFYPDGDSRTPLTRMDKKSSLRRQQGDEFSASFGPFRRFTGGDQNFERLFAVNPGLAAHLSAFDEGVALTEGLQWLKDLHIRGLEGNKQDTDLLNHLLEFINRSDLLPYGVQIIEVRSDKVTLSDGRITPVLVENMSDGYRSILSMIFEILRLMTRSFGIDAMIDALDIETGAVRLPGVVAIDEIDAHLHPSWQKEIGPWFTRCFPEIQFIVTTHSPIICQNATTVWRLPNPGSGESGGRVEGAVLNRLIHGSILDAYGTEFFGRDVARSEESKELLQELARLNRKALKSGLTSDERTRLDELRQILPTSASDLGAA